MFSPRRSMKDNTFNYGFACGGIQPRIGPRPAGECPSRCRGIGQQIRKNKHKWLLATPDGIEPWRGKRPILLNDRRYFIVVGAPCDDRYAIFDTDTSELTPLDVATSHWTAGS